MNDVGANGCESDDRGEGRIVIPKPLRVGVLVDLARARDAGGHVRCWERFAEAAASFPEDVQLTVHFSGERESRQREAANVRIVTHAALFSSRRLPFLGYVPDHSDLAPYHPRLARWLGGYDVVHTTDAYFSFARTASAVCRRRAIPLVNSVHTDTPSYCRVFAARAVERLVGQGRLRALLLERFRIHERIEAYALRALAGHQSRSSYVLVSRPEERDSVLGRLPPHRVRILRRGVDRAFFTPAKRDRPWLSRELGVPGDRIVVLYAGRIDRGKNVMVLAQAVRRLIDDGLPLHLVCAGRGEDRAAVLGLLDGHATCPGFLAPAVLAGAYASADLFAFPSEIETWGNVVQEAMASGLAVVISERGGLARLVGHAVCGLIVGGEGPGPWAEALRRLAGDAAFRHRLGAEARRHAERFLPSWVDVFAEDLLPVWRLAAAERQENGRSGVGDTP